MWNEGPIHFWETVKMSDWDEREGKRIARMCGETYGVCERMKEAKVSERGIWASSYTISFGFNGFVVKETNKV